MRQHPLHHLRISIMPYPTPNPWWNVDHIEMDLQDTLNGAGRYAVVSIQLQGPVPIQVRCSPFYVLPPPPLPPAPPPPPPPPTDLCFYNCPPVVAPDVQLNPMDIAYIQYLVRYTPYKIYVSFG